MIRKLSLVLVASVTSLFSVASLAAAGDATIQNEVNATDVPLVTTGGTVVFDNQVITDVGGDDLEADSKVVLLLPEGTNFSGTPTATSTGGTQLSINSAGDPGTNGQVTLTDTDGDGGNDRAEVTVALGSNGGSVTFKGSLTYSGGTATADLGNLNPSISIRDDMGTVIQADIDNVLATVVKAERAGTVALNAALPTLQNADTTQVLGEDLLLTVPAGTGTSSANDEVTVTFGPDVTIPNVNDVNTITVLTDGAVAPAVALTMDSDGFTLDFGTALARESQFLISIGDITTEEQSAPTNVSVTLSGDAGVTGSADVASLEDNGSTVGLEGSTGDPDGNPIELVRGAAKSRESTDILIEEIFGSDLNNGETITFTAESGLQFDVSGGDPDVIGVATASTVTYTDADADDLIDEFTVTLAGMTGGVDEIEIENIFLVASSTAGSSLEVAVGSDEDDDPQAPDTDIVLATTVNRGDTAVGAFQTSVPKVGPGTDGNTVNVFITEETYGAVSTASNFPFIQFTPIDGVEINSITVVNDATAGPGAGEAVDLANGDPAVPADGSYIVDVLMESSEASEIDGTASDILLQINYDIDSDVPVGTTVTFDVGGNARVDGTVIAATVENNTTSAVEGAIPDYEPSNQVREFAELVITENFTNAVTEGGQFRIIAPTGVTFDGDVVADRVGIQAATVATTFLANDTLLITAGTENADDERKITAEGIIGSLAADGLLEFSIVDGNQSATNKAGVSADTVNLVFNGTIEALDVGADITVNAGQSTTKTIAGGSGDVSATSSNEAVATVTADGNTVTVTGVAEGTATITVTDTEFGSSDTFDVVVNAQSNIPTLTTTRSDGASTDAQVSGGITTDGGATFTGTAAVGETIEIVGTIVPDTNDIGRANIPVLVAVTGPNATPISFVTPSGIVPAGPPIEDVAFSTITLDATNEIDVTAQFGGSITLTSDLVGSFEFYFGYYCPCSDVITFNSEPVELTVTP